MARSRVARRSWKVWAARPGISGFPGPAGWRNPRDGECVSQWASDLPPPGGTCTAGGTVAARWANRAPAFRIELPSWRNVAATNLNRSGSGLAAGGWTPSNPRHSRTCAKCGAGRTVANPSRKSATCRANLWVPSSVSRASPLADQRSPAGPYPFGREKYSRYGRIDGCMALADCVLAGRRPPECPPGEWAECRGRDCLCPVTGKDQDLRIADARSIPERRLGPIGVGSKSKRHHYALTPEPLGPGDCREDVREQPRHVLAPCRLDARNLGRRRLVRPGPERLDPAPKRGHRVRRLAADQPQRDADRLARLRLRGGKRSGHERARQRNRLPAGWHGK